LVLLRRSRLLVLLGRGGPRLLMLSRGWPCGGGPCGGGPCRRRGGFGVAVLDFGDFSDFGNVGNIGKIGDIGGRVL
jgi:hypothetical protein